MADWRGGLASRVMLASIASVALGGLIAAAVAISGVDWLVSRHADRRLLGAASTLAGELEEEAEEQDESVQEVLLDENEEMVTSGIRLALYDGKSLVAGDAWVPHVGGQRCVSRGDVGGRVRACPLRYGRYVIVAAEDREDQMLRWFYLIAGAAAVCIGAAIGGGASLRLARWAIQPLSDLTRKLERVTPEEPDPESLAGTVDVKEVEAVRRALYDTLSRLRDQMTQLERFAADAAHELKTPLTLMRGELELLTEVVHTDPSTSSRLSMTALRAAQLAELIDSLLLLASPLNGLEPDTHPVSLSEIVADVVDELPQTERERVDHSTPFEGLVRGEPILLKILVRNAIDNALKFSEGRVVVKLADLPKAVQLTVSDSGPGIDRKLRERVFEPFFRVRADQTPGHGLGLALVGHIARAHGGAACFEDVSSGSLLTVSLPAWSEFAPAA